MNAPESPLPLARGQVHAALTGIRGADFAPSLDLPLFQRESGLGWRDA